MIERSKKYSLDEFGSGRTIVELTQRDIDDAQRILSILTRYRTKRMTPGEQQLLNAETQEVSPQTLRARAQEILSNRRKRYGIFGKGMFGEPAWEMLLLLYVFDYRTRQTIGKLGELAGSSKTTALRWIDYLEAQHLIHRTSHPTDKRAAFVELTDKGRSAVELYLSETVPSKGA